MKAYLAPWSPQLLSILRIVTGFLFVQHGMQKWFGFPVAMPNPIQLWSVPGIAGMLELVGGALMITGLFTRPVAFVLSGLMAFAYFIAHAPGGFWPIVNRGGVFGFYSFVFLSLAAAGGGPWSLDHVMRNQRDT